MKNLDWGVLSCAISFVALVACVDTVDEISDSIDCNGICERYSDCFEADYDVEGCSDRCESDASASEDRQHRLRVCDECIDDRSCTEATFECKADCAGIVP